ncbi:hypothetical protein GCM10023196_007220 [Actinoallomurus vinaceus]|uniref:Uncharacterized protein n=1 Tax=Actinoallomurus vinaceus TaxID=1080074 RepID=A0ABP8U4S8_9ACTN
MRGNGSSRTSRICHQVTVIPRLPLEVVTTHRDHDDKPPLGRTDEHGRTRVTHPDLKPEADQFPHQISQEANLPLVLFLRGAEYFGDRLR